MSDIKIKVDGSEYDLDDFELGDLEWLEDFLGKPLSDDTALSSMKAAVGFVFIVKRRDNPEFTLEQARRVKLSVLDASTVEDKPRPTRAKGR